MGRGAVHPAGGRRKEDIPAITGAWFALWKGHHCSYFSWCVVRYRWWYRHACAAGGVFNVLLMMGANVVGFVLGVDGARYFAQELVSCWAGKSWCFQRHVADRDTRV